MSISAIDTREEKEQWLIRPIYWGYISSFLGGFMTLCMWLSGVDVVTVLIIAIGANIYSTGMLLWGMHRIIQIARAARGRY